MGALQATGEKEFGQSSEPVIESTVGQDSSMLLEAHKEVLSITATPPIKKKGLQTILSPEDKLKLSEGRTMSTPVRQIPETSTKTTEDLLKSSEITTVSTPVVQVAKASSNSSETTEALPEATPVRIRKQTQKLNIADCRKPGYDPARKRTLQEVLQARKAKTGKAEKELRYNSSMRVSLVKNMNPMQERDLDPRRSTAFVAPDTGDFQDYAALNNNLKEIIQKNSSKAIPKDMLDEDLAKKKFNASTCMNRESTEQELRRTLRTIEDEESREIYEAWWRQSEQYVELEARLRQHDSVVGLKFIPTTGKRKRDGAYTANGHWMALVRHREGEGDETSDDESMDEDDEEANTFHVRVTNDWVEDNFYAPALAIVQKLAYDTRVKYVDKTGARPETLTGCISVSGLAVNDEQISQIKYDGKNDVWKGVVRLPGKTVKSKFVTLEEEWVMENVDESVFYMAKSAGMRGNKKFFYLPEGDSVDHGKVIHDDLAPVMYYRQKIGERTCLLKACASALYYLNEKELANKIFRHTNEKNHLLTGFNFVRNTFQEEARTAGGYQVAGCKKNFDVLNDSPKYWLCLLGLHGSDGKVDHAIAIAGGWIFDANFESALKLSNKNLDLCCSSSESKSRFGGVTKGWLVTKNKSRKKRKKA